MPIRVNGTQNADGTITLTTAESVPVGSQAVLLLRNPSGGEPVQLIVTINSDGTVTIPDFLSPIPNAAMVFQNLDDGQPIKTLVVFNVDGTLNLGEVSFESGNPVLPQVASATLLLNLQANTLELSDGDPVSLWADQSGNGHDFTQTGDACPSYDSAVPSVDGDGIDDWMEGGTGEWCDDLDSFALFIVDVRQLDSLQKTVLAKINNFGTGSGFFMSGNNDPVLLLQDDGGNNYVFLECGLDREIGEKGIITFQVNGRSAEQIKFFYNNAEQTPSDSSAGTLLSYASPDHVLMGRETNADDNGYMSEYISALLFYTPAPNATDRAAIIAWLAGQYGITL